MKTKFKTLIVLLLALNSKVYSQAPCATTEQQEILFANDSMAKKAYLESERILLERTLEKQRLEKIKQKKQKPFVRKKRKKRS